MENKTIQALQNVYKSLGGNIDNVLNINNIPDMLLAISSLETSPTDNINLLNTALKDTEDNLEILQALRNLYVSYGGNIDDVENIGTYADLIEKITEAKIIYNSLNYAIRFTSPYTEEYGVEVGTFQGNYPSFVNSVEAVSDNIYMSDNFSFGNYTLFYNSTFTQVEGGLTDSGALSGTGYFIAFDFVNFCNADSVKVGVEPSENYNELIEIDFNINKVDDVVYPFYFGRVVLKIDDFSTQRIIVQIEKNNIIKKFYLYKGTGIVA